MSDSDGSAKRRDREDGLDPKDDSAGPNGHRPEPLVTQNPRPTPLQVLKPFADALGNIADKDRERWPDDETIEHSGAAEMLTWGHLRAARALYESTGWRDIASAPDDRFVLLYAAETGEQAVCAWMTAIEDGDQGWVMARGEIPGAPIAMMFRGPTHWMPLPPPPGSSDD